MPLESSIQKAGRVSLWVGGCAGLIAIILYLIMYSSKVGAHDEGFAYLFLPLVFAVLMSFIAFAIGVIISFALGLNFALNLRRAKDTILTAPDISRCYRRAASREASST